MTTKEEVTLPLMTVRQLARQGDVTVHVVRNYLRRGLLQAATHTEGGYQLFSTSELLSLHFIRTAQHLGFTLGEIEEIMAVMEVPEVMGATAMPTTHPMASMRAVASGH